MITSKRQINSSRERYVTAITYLTKATRCGISVITIEIEFVKPDKRYCAKQKLVQIIKNCHICSNICITIRKSCLLRIV